MQDVYSCDGAGWGFIVSNSHGTGGWAPPAYGSSFSCQIYAPGFFMVRAAGRNYVAAQRADYSVAGTPAAPVTPGSVILLYGTGFGPTNPTVAAGRVVTTPAPISNLSALTVGIGGVPAQVQWAGITMAGLWQINVAVPSNLPDGDAAVVASILGFHSQDNVFISVRHAP
jgi:uncharacterized protein (TIGR03437 family)